MNVTVEARNDVDTPGVVKLQGETRELNIWATTDELWKLADIEKTDWVQRRTLQVGTCAHAPVWWNELDGTVYIVVGNDDVTWDAGVTVPPPRRSRRFFPRWHGARGNRARPPYHGASRRSLEAHAEGSVPVDKPAGCHDILTCLARYDILTD